MTSEEIKENHLNSWANLWKIYNKENAGIKGFMLWFSISIAVLILVIILMTNVDVYPLIEKIVDINLSIIPGLLGFNLGAYALLIGLASTSFLSKMTQGIDKQFTFFQRASSIFGFCVAIQAICLIISFLIKQILVIQTELSFHEFIIVEQKIVDILNAVTFFFVNFFAIYSVTLVLMIIKNIFGLSQTANFFSGIEHFKNQKDAI